MKQWRLPKVEKEDAVVAAKQLGISDSEFMRMAIIWPQHGIRNGTVDVLTNSALIPFNAVAKIWSREIRVVKPMAARHIQGWRS